MTAAEDSGPVGVVAMIVRDDDGVHVDPPPEPED
jgi:hypothetical protein